MAQWPGTVIEEPTGPFPLDEGGAGAPAAPPADAFPGAEVRSDTAAPDAMPGVELDASGTRYAEGFADQLPTQATARMSPEDEAEVIRMLQSGADASAVRRFVASKGFRFNNADQVVAAREQTGKVNPDAVYNLPRPSDEEYGGALDAGARGVGDTLTMGALQKLNAGVAGIGAAMDGESFGDAYSRQLDYNNGVVDRDEEEHGTARIVGQLIGGLALPSGMEGVAFTAGKNALRAGATMREARAVASTAARNRMAAVGGGYGAAHGAGSADSLGEAATGALSEGATGFAAGTVTGQAAKLAVPRVTANAAAKRAAPIPDAIKFAQATERQGLEYLPADVQGGQAKQIAARMISGITNMTLGGIPLSEAAGRIVEKAKAGRDAIAQAVGVVTDNAGVGQAVQRGARQFMTASERRGDDLFEAIPIDGETDAVLANVRPALRELTAGMKSNPELSRLVAENPRLRKMLDALTPKAKVEPGTPDQPGGMGFGVDIEGVPGSPSRKTGEFEGGKLSWRDLKRFRTIIGEMAGQPMISASLSTKALKKVYAALSEDMRATAAREGPRALSTFERANSYWRGRQNRIEQVLGGVLGDDLQKGAESAARQINTWASANASDFGRLSRLVRSLPQDEADTVRASLISRLGRASAGRQDQGGDVFSPAEFATQWDKIDKRAKAVLFQGEHRAALEDFARVMSGMKASTAYANNSKTALGANGIALITWAIASPIGAAVTAGAQLGAGKLMASTKFAKWLAAAPKKPNAPAFLAHVDRLSALSRAEPVIANDILSLQARLAEAFGGAANDGTARLAAEEAARGTGQRAGVADGQQNQNGRQPEEDQP